MHRLVVLLVLGAVTAQDPASRPASYPERLAAIRAMAGTQDRAEIGELLAILRQEKNPNLRAAAAESLAGSRDERVFDALRDALARDTDPGPRGAIAKALGASRDPRAYDLLLPVLEERVVGALAAQALGVLGDPRAFAPIAKRYDVQRREPYLQELAPRALLALDGARALPILLERFAGDEQGLYPLERVLRERREPQVREAMHAHLGAEDAARRLAAVRVLAHVGDEDSADRLIQFWEREPQARVTIANAFATLRARKVGNFLADALPRAEDPELRTAIAFALGRSGEPRHARQLCDALAKEDAALAKVRLLEALGRLGEPRAIATLARFLDDDAVTRQNPDLSSIRPFPENARVRDVAAWAIVTLRDGKEPFPAAQLSGFPTPPPVRQHGQLAGAREWCASHRDDERYRWPR